ncbi:hypothetical protein OROMI_003889 [Orobanche minor]
MDLTQRNVDEAQIMGMFATKANQSPKSIPLFGVLLIVLVITGVDNLATQTKTIIGYNLKPTPWHDFPAKEFNDETKIARASKIIQCSPTFPMDISRSRAMVQNRHFTRPINGSQKVRFISDRHHQRKTLLKRFPGRIPDVDMMFDCMDKPIIEKNSSTTPLPIFRYCTTPNHYDIPFPDWSFWGWPEINIGPWKDDFESIKQDSQKQSWKNKYPYAYWRGNPDVVSEIRQELLMCNDTEQWGAHIMRQNWTREVMSGFKQSKLSNQCDHRYKIYAERRDTLGLRGLFPKINYLPISPQNICPSIKTAVDWGNEHPVEVNFGFWEAEEIGKSVQDFMENLDIDRIYDYMYHLIVEYAKLLDFKPIRPSSSHEESVDSLYCFADQNQTSFLARSATTPSEAPPCTLPQPANRQTDNFLAQKARIVNTTQLLM